MFESKSIFKYVNGSKFVQFAIESNSFKTFVILRDKKNEVSEENVNFVNCKSRISMFHCRI
jgi:hypothetical protein